MPEGKKLPAPAPVREEDSYSAKTHLHQDVYKRQARPFVSPAVIAAVLEAAARCGAAAPAVPVKDTIKQAVPGDGKTAVSYTHLHWNGSTSTVATSLWCCWT